MVDSQQIERNRALQTELYGEPLSALISRIGTALALSQAKLADVIGLSPAMLSQLAGGQRVKIGNPAVAERVRALDELAGQYDASQLTPADLAERLQEIRQLTGAISRPTSQRESHSVPVVRSVQGLLRAVASADEILGAAKLLEKEYPAIAEVLKSYGAERTEAALEHYARVRPLL